MTLRIRKRASKHGGYGWRPELPDIQDYIYSAPLMHPSTIIPSSVDLRSQCPAVYDQGQLGSCVSNAVAAAIEFDQMKQRQLVFAPSRLFIYYNGRVSEGSVGDDAGLEVRDGIKAVVALGAPPENDWPYDIGKFADKPPATVYATALTDLVTVYMAVPQDVNSMKSCLAAGFPFVFGFTVYDSFESDDTTNTGMVKLPDNSENALGGHCVVAVGYDDGTQFFTVRNSWGTIWGDKGYCYFPYDYLTNTDLSSDFWTIRTVTG